EPSLHNPTTPLPDSSLELLRRRALGTPERSARPRRASGRPGAIQQKTSYVIRSHGACPMGRSANDPRDSDSVLLVGALDAVALEPAVNLPAILAEVLARRADAEAGRCVDLE